MPHDSDVLSEIQLKKIESKLIQIINNSGNATFGYSNDFVVYPVISLENTGVVEGGMQNITVATIEVSLFVKQISTNLVYGTVDKKLKGSGNNQALAISNAISQINNTDPVFNQFIAASKNKIVHYYQTNCSAIISQAKSLALKKEYEQAISILYAIPPLIGNCYDESEKLSLTYYLGYQKNLCAKNMQIAQGYMALKEYKEALDAILVIDPSSPCYQDAKKVISQISQKIDIAHKEEMNLESQRIAAVKEIAKAYYSRTIRYVNYYLVAEWEN